ncbi:hypothetical protein RY831_01085 [Noviherbaspirillum sp. CPCC 100848]|uniref:Uncharacterized protein n=1 Tax=Noviherbaspirillum album TaxID=3080276 RepID=A0ABU6J346_9BURK|nr:hypothetical protein [Noviherbaspirillum sp. CPCC 100848]MEC4717732.1 hypothetical protein [Noviherbaspirillum sp. CPCC 100848]
MTRAQSEDAALTREMGCTEADLVRWLPGATRHAPIESHPCGAGLCHVVALESGRVEILAIPMPPRRIAGIVLPVLQVSFRFIGLDTDRRQAFMDYFDRYTRRGGG